MQFPIFSQARFVLGINTAQTHLLMDAKFFGVRSFQVRGGHDRSVRKDYPFAAPVAPLLTF